MVEMLAHVGTLYLNTGIDQNPQGSAHPFIMPWQAFRCSDNKYIVVAPARRTLSGRSSAPSSASTRSPIDPSSPTPNRVRHTASILLPLLESTFKTRPSRQWLELLQAGGVPAAPVNRMPEMFSDNHIAVRHMVKSFDMAGQQMRSGRQCDQGRRASTSPMSHRRRCSAVTQKMCWGGCSVTRRSRSKRLPRRVRSAPPPNPGLLRSCDDAARRRARSHRGDKGADRSAVAGDHLRGRQDRHPGMGPRRRLRRPRLLRRIRRPFAGVPPTARTARISRGPPVPPRRAGTGPTHPRSSPSAATKRERRDGASYQATVFAGDELVATPVFVDIKERNGSLGRCSF